jgi:geranylgeranyl reductase family protein
MVMNTDYDVVIVGAGVAGSFTGIQLAKSGYKVLLVEEHREVGRPVQCAGLVTPRISQLIPELDPSCIINKVHGAKIYSPLGKELIIDAGEPKALVVDRLLFDRFLASAATKAGAELFLGTKAVSAKRIDGNVEVEILKNNEKISVSCKLIIGADGVQSQVSTWFGLKRVKTILSGFGAEMTGVDIEPGFVEIYLGNNVAPNFFSWIIPKADSKVDGAMSARVGLVCAKSNNRAISYYRALFDHPIAGPKLKHSKPVHLISGGVPIGTVSKSYIDNAMLVGDSAGQVKPTSGGGIYTSLVCAQLCAETAVLALEKNDCSAKVLKRYQKAWQNRLGKELKHGMRLHKVYMHLTDSQLEEGFKLLSDESILNIISKKGDIDYPSKVTKELFKRVPQLLKFAKPYIRSFF